MAVKATFLSGQTTTTTDALHQWDYGQQLEIEAAGLPTIVEVHFACHGMEEAIIRPCSFTAGIATTMVPDICLEQASSITAWVFVINGTEGMTKLTITIPVKARTRPNRSDDIPLDLNNVYTELLTEINEATKGIQSGDITAAKALTATSANTAGYAQQAGHAETAESAKTAEDSIRAGYAERAYIAEKAEVAVSAGSAEQSAYANELNGKDGEPNFSASAFSPSAYLRHNESTLKIPKGVYMFRVYDGENVVSLLMDIAVVGTVSPQFLFADQVAKLLVGNEEQTGKRVNVFIQPLVGSSVGWNDSCYWEYRPVVLYESW